MLALTTTGWQKCCSVTAPEFFFETLNTDERERREAHRAARLLEGEGGARSIDALLAQLDVLSDSADEKAQRVFELLSDYAELISPEMG